LIDARFVPITDWPGKKTTSRQRSPFSAKYASTLDLLEAELKHLSAKDITIQAYFDRRDIRNDGWPRSSARPSQPGVIVSFEQRKGTYQGGKWVESIREFSFPCDRFLGWEDNLRAIALALEALRKVDRYGVTQSGEQYKGWARLPAPGPAGEMSREEAALFIAGYAVIPKDYLLHGSASFINEAYRKAAAKLHPDSQSGSNELFLRLQKAKQILESRV